MIKNLNTPEIKFLRSQVYFREPKSLYLKSDKIDEEDELLRNPKQWQPLQCCICYQVLSLPRKCGKCGFQYCAGCKIEQDKYLISCPNYDCGQHVNTLPDKQYMDRYSKLYIQCQNNGCEKTFSIKDDEQIQVDHFFNRCIFLPKKCRYCHLFPISRQNLEKHHLQDCKKIPKTCQLCLIKYQQNEEHECIKAMASLLDQLTRQVNEHELVIRQMREEVVKDRNMNIESSKSGRSQAYPVPRSKNDKRNQRQHNKKSSSQMALVPPLNLNMSKNKIQIIQSDQNNIGQQYSLEFSQQNLMSLNKIQELNLVINSISEHRPTPREVREHKENLLNIQDKLHQQLTQLFESHLKLQQEIQYGVLGYKMHSVCFKNVETTSNHLRSTQISKLGNLVTQSSTQNQDTPRQQIIQDNQNLLPTEIIKSQSNVSSKKIESMNGKQYHTLNQSYHSRYIKVIIQVEKFKLYNKNKKLKNIAIKIEMPQSASPDERFYIFISREIKDQNSRNKYIDSKFKETFILLYKEGTHSRDKQFVISLVDCQKNGKVMKDFGQKQTFMIEQIPEGRFGEKEIHIYPEGHKNDKVTRKGGCQRLSYEEDSSVEAFQKKKEALIAKIQLKMQIIKDESQLLQDSIFTVNQMLEEVQGAIEHLQILDQSGDSNNYYQQMGSSESISEECRSLPSKKVQNSNPKSNHLIQLHDPFKGEDFFSNRKQGLNLGSDMLDLGTTFPDTFQKYHRETNRAQDIEYGAVSIQPNFFEQSQEIKIDSLYDPIQYSQASLVQRHRINTLLTQEEKQNLRISGVISRDQNQSSDQDLQRIKSLQILNPIPRFMMMEQYPKTQKSQQRKKINFLGSSNLNQEQDVFRDESGHIRNSSSQEAGFYIAQHELKSHSHQKKLLIF